MTFKLIIDYKLNVILLIKKKKRSIFIGLGIVLITGSIPFIVFSFIEINYQQTILEEQLKIMDENRKYMDNIGDWEVVGGSEEDILEGIDAYYSAVSKYQEAVLRQAIVISLIIFLFGTDLFTGGILIFNKKSNKKDHK